ncbi:phosphatase 2C containing protein [Aphelenchoides avenae]|nr:phosphatase 2C containing protein [Aphelenchus avenae]
MGTGFRDDAPITEKKGSSGKGPDFKYAVMSMQGWRSEMEDTHRIEVPFSRDPPFNKWSFFAVFDGHSSKQIAKGAAANIVEALLSTTQFQELAKEVTKNGDKLSSRARQLLGEGLKAGFMKLDVAMREKCASQAEQTTGGCTALCAILTPSHVFLANLGDSRGVYNRQGQEIFATKDHKPTDHKEHKRIQEAGGEVHRGRVEGSLAMSRTLGDYQYKCEPNLPLHKQEVSPEPSVFVLERNRDTEDFLVLACDGIFDVVQNEELIDLINARKIVTDDLEYVTQQILDTCLSKGSTDSMTMILVAFDNAPEPKEASTEKGKQRMAHVERQGHDTPVRAHKR